MIINLNYQPKGINKIFISDKSNIFRYQTKSFARLCVVMRTKITFGNSFQ